VLLTELVWKSVKYEDIYLKAYGSIKGPNEYFVFYNQKRWHQSLDRKTPAMVYFKLKSQRQVAA